MVRNSASTQKRAADDAGLALELSEQFCGKQIVFGLLCKKSARPS